VVDILEPMKVKWRLSMSSLKTKIESYILKGYTVSAHAAQCIDVEGIYIEK
jgi:hypothetical protein